MWHSQCKEWTNHRGGIESSDQSQRREPSKAGISSACLGISQVMHVILDREQKKFGSPTPPHWNITHILLFSPQNGKHSVTDLDGRIFSTALLTAVQQTLCIVPDSSRSTLPTRDLQVPISSSVVASLIFAVTTWFPTNQQFTHDPNNNTLQWQRKDVVCVLASTMPFV